MTKTKKINYFSIIKNIAIVLHIIPVIFLASLPICIIFEEYFAILPILLMGSFVLIIAQILFHLFKKEKQLKIIEAMIIASISWFLCSVIGAYFYYLIAKFIPENFSPETKIVFSDFFNCLFESFSGFTTTGFSMVEKPSLLPHILQWFRSFQQWIGGMGLIVFILSIVDIKKEDYQLYIAEGKQGRLGAHIKQTLLYHSEVNIKK
jgi:trk system potassium uptake protein